MKRITITKCDDNTILVTSDTNKIGTKSVFEGIKDEDKRMMIALADFLGYESSSVLCFDDEEWD